MGQFSALAVSATNAGFYFDIRAIMPLSHQKKEDDAANAFAEDYRSPGRYVR